MKKLIRLGVLFAAAATAFTACSNDPAETDASEAPRIRLTLRAGNPEITPDIQSQSTRTEMEGTTPYWSVGDRIGVSTDGTSSNNPFTNDATERAQTTTFSGTVSVGSTIYTYYPYTENGISGTGSSAGARVDIPANQTPTATSFDGRADLLIGKPLTMTADGTVVDNLRFKRMGAIVRIVLKDNSTGGVLGGQHVSTLSLTTDGDNYLAGRVTLNLKEGLLLDPYYNQSNKVTATYTSATQYAIDGTSATYLGVFPRVLPAGSTLRVEASTEGYDISRTITLGQDIDLKTSVVTTLNIGLRDEHIAAVATGMALPFKDDFSDLTGNGTAPDISARKDMDGNPLYTASDKVYQYNTPHGLRLGTSSATGYLTTSELDLSQPFTVMISAKAWPKDATGLKITAGENTTLSTENLTEEFKTYMLTFDAQGPKAKLKFEPSVAKKRLILETIIVVTGTEVTTLTLTSDGEVSIPAIGDIATITYSVTNPTVGAVATADAGSAEWINSFDTSEPGEVSFLVDGNTTGAPRSGEIILTYPNAINSVKVVVTQLADKFEAAPQEVVLGGNANDAVELRLTSDYPLGVPSVSDPSRFSIGDPVDNVYTVTALADGGETEAQLGTITFTRTIDNKTLVIPVSQTAKGAKVTKYTKITDLSQLTEGDYYLSTQTYRLYNGKVASGHLQTTVSAAVADGTNVVNIPTDAVVVKLVPTDTANQFDLLDSNNNYINVTKAGSGGFKLGTAQSTSWTFSVGSSGWIAKGSNFAAYIREYNHSSFRSYGNTTTGEDLFLIKVEN